MNTEQVLQMHTINSAESLALAARLGTNVKGGEVIELISDLGGGKTTFVRGLAQGIGSADPVSSPSFTLTNQYQADNLTIHHFDFYRLTEAGVLRDELSEILQDKQNIVIIEWADVIADVLPIGRLKISIRVTAETERAFTFEYPTSLAYLLENLKGEL